MSQSELDQAVAKIHSEQVDDQTVKAAAKRVFSGLFDSAFITAEPVTGKIRGCLDVRALIPAYLNRTLSAARALLVEDHAFHCVDCRHALQQARSGVHVLPAAPTERSRNRRVAPFVWAIAAALLVGIGLGITGLVPGQNSVRATVASVEGRLYRVTEFGVSLVEAGAIIKNSDELRTAKGSRAILRLASGISLEIAERSEISLSAGWRGPAVNLEHGQMIVEARAASQEPVFVTSGEMTIPVRGGVVAVDHGTKESRVAVAQGLVDVQMGQSKRRVSAGQLYGGELHMASMPISSEFAWSQNSASYLALLKEQLSHLQEDFAAIPSPGVRYASRLPQYLPADTFLYAAVPNMGRTISEAKKLFDSRLAESEVLRQWWQQQAVSKNGEFDHMLDQVSSISSYLGDEIVVAVGGAVSGEHAGPVMLAEIKQPGLADYLQSNLPANAGIQLVTSAVPGAHNKLLVDLTGNILVASPNAEQLKRVEDIIQSGAASQFTSTPFFARVSKVYNSGAGYFLAANLEQISAKSVSTAKGGMPPGFENVQYLVLERKEAGGDAEMRAAVSFDGARHGIASWLGAPGPAGSLDFVSADANFAASLVMKNPRAMMQELLSFAGGDATFAKELNSFETQAGVSLLDDVAAPLGSDVTFALDGPLLPVPWKLVIEVYDAERLQQTLKTFIDRFNQQASAKAGHLTITDEQINGRKFHTLSNDKFPMVEAAYTFVDGYLLASSSKSNVQDAINNKQAGHILASSPNFRQKLPADGYPNFSAMVYSNLGSSLGELAKQFNSSPALSSGRAPSFGALVAKGGSGLVCVYGETDRILATARGSFMGFDLGTLIGIQQGKSLHSIIASAPVAAAKGIPN